MKLYPVASSFSPRTVLLPVIGIFVVGLTFPSSADAQQQTKMSKGLRSLVSAGTTGGDVIYEGPQAEVERLAATYGLTVKKKMPTGAVLSGSASRIESLSRDGQVGYLTEDVRVTGMMAVATRSTGANLLWEEKNGNGKLFGGLTGKGIGVAIIDSGIANHPDLRNRILYEFDFTGTGTDDGYGHGTHVASIVAGSGAGSRTPAGSSYVGMAPGASLISLKVLGNDGTGYVSDVICAIEWAIQNRHKFGIRVINLSLGHPSSDS